jgi:ABC-2 type transport system ATP-binding protein
VLGGSRGQVAGDLDTLLATHYRLTGPRRDPGTLPAHQDVIAASHTDRQTTLVVQTAAQIYDPAWTVSQLTLEDLVLAYMGRSAYAPQPALEAVR